MNERRSFFLDEEAREERKATGSPRGPRALEKAEGRQVTANGQGQRKAAQWSKLITRYRQSGMGSRQFWEAEGLTLRTFEQWKRRQRSVERGKGQFVEVKAPSVAASPGAVEVE